MVVKLKILKVPWTVCVCSATSVVSDSLTPWTLARQAPLSMRILQARILDCVAMSFSRGSSQPRDWTHVSQVSCVGRQVLYPEPPGKPTSALNPITSTLIRAREERQTRRRPCENRGRDYCCAARSQGMAGATRRWKRKEGSSLKASGEPGSVNTFFKKNYFIYF